MECVYMIQVLVVLISCEFCSGFEYPSSAVSDVSQTVTASTECISCNKTCPGRTALPDVSYPLSDAGCLDKPTSLPILANRSNGEAKFDGGDCDHVNTTEATGNRGYFTVSLWVKATCSKSCQILSFGDSAQLIYSGTSLNLSGNYIPANLTSWRWISIRFNGDMYMFVSNINSTFQSGENFVTSDSLNLTIGPMRNISGNTIEVVDVRWFNDSLTSRELEQLRIGASNLEVLEVESNCRCPGDFPVLDSSTKPNKGLKCLSNNGSAPVSRLNTDGGYAVFLLDRDMGTRWVSGSVKNVTLTLELKKSHMYQIQNVTFLGMTQNIKTIQVDLYREGSKRLSKFCSPGSDCSYDGSGGLSLKIEDAAANITRIKYENLLADKLVITLSADSPVVFSIAELNVGARCGCYGNNPTCAISADGAYTCATCVGNTTSTHCDKCSDEHYRSDKDFVCPHSCQCNKNGSASYTCKEVGGACTCKSNVEGHLCDKCKHNTVNLGSNSSSGCTNCTCDLDGSVHCNDNMTCLCKPNVQGRRCDECKEAFYDLTSGCGNRCNCEPLGTEDESKVCKITSGQCPCTWEYRDNRKCEPKVTSVEPMYGPEAGGTLVTVRGELLTSDHVDTRVVIGSVEQTLVSNDSSTLIFRTKPREKSEIPLNLLVKWTLTKNVSHTRQSENALAFEFKANPVLNATHSITTYASGGCKIRVPGTNIDSVAHPGFLVYYAAGKSVKGDCCLDAMLSDCSADSLSCKTPDLIAHLTALQKSEGVSFNYTFQMDGASENVLISSEAQLKVVDDPSINMLSEKDTYKSVFSDSKYKIVGSNLNTACHDEDDVQVLLGDEPCTLVERTDNYLACSLEEKFPGNSREVNVTVRIGNKVYYYGRLEFLTFWQTTEFYGIAAGAGAFVIIVIVIVIVCCCRRRGDYDKQTDIPDSLDVDAKRSGSNNYTPITQLPLQEIIQPTSKRPPSSITVSASDAFFNRMSGDDRKDIKSSLVLRENIEIGKTCTRKGKQYCHVVLGQFSSSASTSNSGSNLTIKMLRDKLPEGQNIPEWLIRELKECIRFRDSINENILKMIGIAVDAKSVYILYHEMENRTMKEYYIKETAKKEVPLDISMNFCVQVAEGMNFLSTKGMTHKDLACRNCWVTGDMVVKIADSSFSADLFPEEYMAQGDTYIPVRWMAPHSLLQAFFSSQTDVWSYGVLLWEIFTDCGYLPFYDITDAAEVKKRVCHENYKLVCPPDCPDVISNVMERCFETNEDDRPTFSTIVNDLTPGEGNIATSYVNAQRGYVNKGVVDQEDGLEDYANQSQWMTERQQSMEIYMNQ
ncbi:hepatocyte growth factor receptor-like isoform X2 [Mya arenaria]|uniref:hepatocyte growth factor receptor-like isoform X2 n=1 Tax=Mya arenaria TaxID=6604 RepID=UPI0022E557D4|nr:hepatocyte growth factor receptor-like isoform X2 [Mya arenaria]